MGITAQKVLIIEDDATTVKSVTSILSDLGLEVFAIDNGNSAVEKTKEINPDLILLDIIMPEINGHEVCQNLKKDFDTCSVPIIFLTSKDSTKDIVQGFKYGGADYICKPFKREEFRARVTTQLKLQKEINQRKIREQDLKETVAKLRKALTENNQLKELLPICCNCKRIRNDEGYWKLLEQFFDDHAGVQFSHSVCPQCIPVLYPDYAKR